MTNLTEDLLKVFWQNKNKKLKIFLILTFPVLENLKDSIFEIPIISQTLNFNNLRIVRVKSINLDIIRKLIDCSLKDVNKWICGKNCDYFLC